MAHKMIILVVLFGLVVLALGSPQVPEPKQSTGGAADEAARAEKVAATFCDILCKEKGEPANNCREFCGLRQLANAVFLEGILCKSKCSELKDVPAIKSCEGGCAQRYEAGVAAIINSCHTLCSKGEKDSILIETCKKSCTSPAVAGPTARG